ncbi:hypothetical protein RSAG8_04575, partial [Rhizoctonia solani AG-8 WAC10335]
MLEAVGKETNCPESADYAMKNMRVDPFNASQLIHGLPDEILAHIFDYVIKMKPCPASPRCRTTQATKQPPFMIDPLIMSHVCSRWRQIAIHTPILWSHIDLQPDLDKADVPRAIARLEAFVERSGQTLLDIHILDPPPVNFDPFDVSRDESESYLQPLIEFIAPHTKCLTLESSSGLDDGNHPRATLAAFFAKCVPGTLKTLTIEIPASRPSYSPWGSYLSAHDRATLGLPMENLESLLHSITTLRLCGYYPRADSKAYHGSPNRSLKMRSSPQYTLIAWKYLGGVQPTENKPVISQGGFIPVPNRLAYPCSARLQ